MGFRLLTPQEQAAHENSLRKLGTPAAEPVKAVNAAPAESAPEVDSQDSTDASDAAVAPAAAAPTSSKSPFKKKG